MTSLSGELLYNYPLTLDGLEPINVVSNDILASSLQVSGSNAMQANLPMGGHVLSGLGDGSISSHSCTYGQLTALSSNADSTYLKKSGGVLTGTVSSTTVTTPLDFSNTGGALNLSLTAGTSVTPQPCSIKMASNSSSTLEFRDNASNVKSQLKYTYGAPGSLNMLVNGVTALSATDAQATFGVPIAMSNKQITGLLAASSDDGVVNRLQMSNADSAVVASSVQKTGSALTGGLTWSNVATPLAATNTGDALNLSLTAGTSVTPQPCSIKMASNSQSYTEFTDVAGVTKAWIRYLASGGGSIDLTVANNPMATLTSSTVTLGGTVQLGGNRVTGMGAPTADTDAATRLYVTNADTVVTNNSVQKSGSTMIGSLDMGGTNRVTNMAASSVNGDAVRRQELYGVYLPLAGGTLTGALVANAGLTVNGAGITVNAPTVMNGNLTINGGVLARNMWYPGETIQRKWLSPALSDTLTTSSFAAGSSATLVTTTLPVTAYNQVLVKGAFEVTADNSADDKYRIEFGFSTQTVTFNNVLGAVNGYRTRYGMYEFMFVPTSSGTKTIKATLHNDSTSDTITVNTANWGWTIEEIQGI